MRHGAVQKFHDSVQRPTKIALQGRAMQLVRADEDHTYEVRRNVADKPATVACDTLPMYTCCQGYLTCHLITMW